MRWSSRQGDGWLKLSSPGPEAYTTCVDVNSLSSRCRHLFPPSAISRCAPFRLEPLCPFRALSRPERLGTFQNTTPDLRENRSGVRGGGGNRTRVLQLLNGPSPSAADQRLSGWSPRSALVAFRIRLRCPRWPVGTTVRVSPTYVARIRSVGLRPVGRHCALSSDCELRLGICFCFRLFNVAPETTARFSHIDDRSRSLSPPWLHIEPCCPVVGVPAYPPLPVALAQRGGSGPGQRVLPRVAARASRAASRPASRAAMARRLS